MLIAASIGINSFAEDKVKKIILAGADILRYNFSYRNTEENLGYVRVGKKAIESLNSSVRLMIDLPNDRVRLGNFSLRLFGVRENEEFIFQTATFSPDCNQFIPVQLPKIGEKVKQDQTIIIGDGEIAIQVMEIINADSFRARILNNGILEAMRGIGLKQDVNEKKYLKNFETRLKKIKEANPNYVAIPFVNPDIEKKVRSLDIWNDWHTKIILKIDNEYGLEHFDRICEDDFYDMVLLDRGEIGVNMPFAKNAVIQKQITERAKNHNKPLMVSTQILESTIDNLIPNRSDIADLTHLVWDGVSGILLCRETGVGLRPAYAISVAKKIIEEAENYKKTNTQAS